MFILIRHIVYTNIHHIVYTGLRLIVYTGVCHIVHTDLRHIVYTDLRHIAKLLSQVDLFEMLFSAGSSLFSDLAPLLIILGSPGDKLFQSLLI